MHTIVLGDGPMGRALESALAAAPDVDSAAVLGRPPDPAGHHPNLLRRADVVFDFSRPRAVAENVRAALAAGCRSLVIGTTGWEQDRALVGTLLQEHGAAAVVAPNFSSGLAVFAGLVEDAAWRFGALPAFDPFIVEWHRRGKADRPSGTARDLAARMAAVHPDAERRADDGGDASGPRQLELAVIRAGSSPGMHLVGFDAPGETIELRITARDRSAYAEGALEAARWLARERRPAGIHSFSEVIAELLERRPAEPAIASA